MLISGDVWSIFAMGSFVFGLDAYLLFFAGEIIFSNHQRSTSKTVYRGGNTYNSLRKALEWYLSQSRLYTYPPWTKQLGPENQWLEDSSFPFGVAYFQGHVRFREGIEIFTDVIFTCFFSLHSDPCEENMYQIWQFQPCFNWQKMMLWM